MKLYDFSRYYARRQEMLAARAVLEVVQHLNDPGAVIELKERVQHWCRLHQEILQERKVG